MDESEDWMKEVKKEKERTEGMAGGKEWMREVKEGKVMMEGSERGKRVSTLLPSGFLLECNINGSVSVQKFFVCLQSATETPDVLLQVVTRHKGQTITSAVGTFTHNPPRTLSAIILSSTNSSVSVQMVTASVRPITQWLLITRTHAHTLTHMCAHTCTATIHLPMTSTGLNMSNNLVCC